MNPFQSLRSYEEFVYTLPTTHPSIERSTLVVAPHGRRTAILQGDLSFDQGYRVSIRERLSMDDGAITIESYGYEIWCNIEKIAWYDSQPHPGDPILQATAPHHKHLPPNIKHNRVPAPHMSFTRPNLSALVEEIEHLSQSSDHRLE